MGLTYVHASIWNPAQPGRAARRKFPVDSGALYSVVPAPSLRRRGIKPGKTRAHILADGTAVRRSIGQTLFRLNGGEGASPIIFGESGDTILPGSASLEALGLMLDPIKHELLPLPMMRYTVIGLLLEIRGYARQMARHQPPVILLPSATTRF